MKTRTKLRLALLSATLLAVYGCSSESQPDGEMHEFVSPNGQHAIVIQSGVRMLYRHERGGRPVLVKEWGSSALPLWSPNSSKVVVWAHDETTTHWCELYRVENGMLVGGENISTHIHLSVPGGHHWCARPLTWNHDSSGVWIHVHTYGDGGVKDGVFLVRADDGKLLKELLEINKK